MKISIVTTLFKSSKYIEEFYNRISKEAKKITQDYEVIFVDDGSEDNGNEIVMQLKKKDKNIKLVQLSKNFGHHQAMIAGLDSSDGDYIFLIDVDLEDQPEWLSIFYEQLINNNCDVVYGKQKIRQGNLIRNYFGFIWYKFIRNFLKVYHDENICTTRIMTRKYVEELKKYKEKSFIISALFELTGFKQKSLLINKTFRNHSNYTFKHKFLLVIKFIIGYSSKLLYLTAAINLFTSLFALIFSVVIIINKLLNSLTIPGWASIMVLISLFYFFTSLSLTIISLYLAEINTETKSRPRYIIKSIR